MRARITVCVIALALALRLLVPAGWMPVAGNGYAITLCTGMGAVSAWMDDAGNIHRNAPSPTQKADHPCVFAGFAAAITAPDPLSAASLFTHISGTFAVLPIASVAIGRGLAAPPPPPTGPPAAA